MFHFGAMTQTTESTNDSGCLHAPIQVEFDYTRSLGSVLSKFMTGLRDHQVYAAKLSDGSVVCPPRSTTQLPSSQSMTW